MTLSVEAAQNLLNEVKTLIPPKDKESDDELFFGDFLDSIDHGALEKSVKQIQKAINDANSSSRWITNFEQKMEELMDLLQGNDLINNKKYAAYKSKIQGTNNDVTPAGTDVSDEKMAKIRHFFLNVPRYSVQNRRKYPTYPVNDPKCQNNRNSNGF